jgi:sigma-B regulation protein RsbU (phosphoserine phosphatase)
VEQAAAAVLVVFSPSGTQSRVGVERVPFRIGRLAENDLVLRDSRASREHARILYEGGAYVLEDLESSHGVFVNGERVKRKKLRDGDRIDFGFADSYRLTFSLSGRHAMPEAKEAASAGLAGANLPKLRAMLELARALQTSHSTEDVLAAVVEAALAVTGCERGFLLLRRGADLEIRTARSRSGPLAAGDLRVPTRLLLRALNQRRDFLSMNFEPEEAAAGGERTIADLDLRSVVCVPLVRIRAGSAQQTGVFSPAGDTVGLLYMDSRLKPADLSSGGRELLTTLALEASTVLENARLLEEQWARQRMEQELDIARRIQESLMPRALPETGWFRAAASNVPSLAVGGDYIDLRQRDDTSWAAVVADVSGKGVGAALLASLLQGMFVTAPFTELSMERMMFHLNHFLNERTGGERYATLFYCTISADGTLEWVSAGHPPVMLVRGGCSLEFLMADGVPLGMLAGSVYVSRRAQLAPGDKLVLYTDGLTDAQNTAREFFGLKRLRETVLAHAGEPCRALHLALRSAVEEFSEGAAQNDDISAAVIEYRP